MVIFKNLEKSEKFNIETKTGRNNFISFCSILGIVLNIVLSVFKISIGLISNSIAILTDGINNLYDIFSSFISFVGVKLADLEADDGHPYGHGRIEYVASLFISIIIVLMGISFLKASILKVINPENVLINKTMIIILFISIIIKVYIYLYNKKYSKKLNSLSLEAVAKDSLADVLITSLVLGGSLIFMLFQINIDGYIGILIAIFIIYSGWGSGQESIHILIGVAPRYKTFQNLENFIVDNEKFHGIHHLIVHDYGPNCLMMTLHVEVKSGFDFNEAYYVQEQLENKIKEEFGYKIFIKLEPAKYAKDSEEVRSLEEKIQNKLKDYVKISNFRVTDNSSSFIIFDTEIIPGSIPGMFRNSETFLTKEIKKYNPELKVVMNIKAGRKEI